MDAGKVARVAITKICGVETEYGIVIRGVDESNPIAASSMLINAYLHETGARPSRPPAPQRRLGLRGRVARQRRPRRPRRRAPWRPRSRPTSSTPCSPTAPATTSTTPTPSCPRPSAPTPARSWCSTGPPSRSCIESMEAARRILPEGQEIVVYKNNSDGKGNSYGCHENYLMDRAVPFGRIVTHVTPHFITRQIFTGAGKVGTEASGLSHRRRAVPAHPARRLLRGGGRARDHAQAPDRQHPRRAPLRRHRSTAACTSSSATPTCPRSPPSSRSAPPRSCWP